MYNNNILVYQSIMNLENDGEYLINESRGSMIPLYVFSILFMIWRFGRFDDAIMPSNKKLADIVGCNVDSIAPALEVLKKYTVIDDYNQSHPLLSIRKRTIKGAQTTVYNVALPKFGTLVNPENWRMGDNGGEAMQEKAGYYIKISPTIQSLTDPKGKLLSCRERLFLALTERIREFKRSKSWNYATFQMFGFKNITIPSIKTTFKRLEKYGYIEADLKENTGGWTDVRINTEIKPEEEQTIKEVIESKSEYEEDELDEFVEDIEDELDEYIDDVEEIEESPYIYKFPTQEETDQMAEKKEKVLTQEQIAFRKAIEMEKEETRKQTISQPKQEEEEVDFDWLASQV